MRLVDSLCAANQRWSTLAPGHDRLLVVMLVAAAVATRLLPHPPNFTATGAVVLFAGGCLRPAWALLVCLTTLLVSDALLGFYRLESMIAVYAATLAGVPIGYMLLHQRRGPLRLLTAAAAAALVFCGVSNLGVWWLHYPHTLAGLLACYTAAWPFCGRTLLGNCVWLPALFFLRTALGHAVMRLRAPVSIH